MSRFSFSAAVLAFALVAARGMRADDEAAARAIVDKAIKASGGEAELSKYKASSSKMKGTVHTQGMELPFTGEIFSQGAEQQRIEAEIEVENQKFSFVSVLNRDKAWMKIAAETSEMDEDKLVETKEAAHAGWVATLAPLKDKEYKLATVGEAKVGDELALGVRVSRKGRRDVNLYFDKKTHLLVKTETRVKDDETGQEVTEESFLSGHADKGLRQAMKLSIKRDGKPYVEAELTEFKAEEKLDDSVFGKP